MSGNQRVPRIIWILAALVILTAVLLIFLPRKAESDYALTLDGSAWRGGTAAAGRESSLRVIVTLDGREIAALPFGEAHVLRVTLREGGVNEITLTGDSVSMTEADCPNQDCVHMGAVTAENLETRAMGGFIVCLPHRLAVEVREREAQGG
ncbi:MAG: NusG domain II-containing protein [Clostridia bacterium]|nr:NusG domain II-containing protein [Clostridia bacterium]